MPRKTFELLNNWSVSNSKAEKVVRAPKNPAAIAIRSGPGSSIFD